MVEPRVVQLQGEGVLEVDPAPDRLGRLPVGEVEQELQHTDRGELGRRESGAAVARVPGGEVPVVPESVEVITYPHRRSAAGLLARAIWAVSLGTTAPDREQTDTDHLRRTELRRTIRSVPSAESPCPENSKIPDRVAQYPLPVLFVGLVVILLPLGLMTYHLAPNASTACPLVSPAFLSSSNRYSGWPL